MQYLMAYQVNLLREAVLYTEPSAELSPEQQADARKEALLLEQNVEMFASRCFKGCEEVSLSVKCTLSLLLLEQNVEMFASR